MSRSYATTSIPNTVVVPNYVGNEVVSGSGTSYTLANTPLINSQTIYAKGQFQTLSIDYTISGKVITFISGSWAAGDIIAYYLK